MPQTNSNLAEAAHARTRGEYLQGPSVNSGSLLHRTSAYLAQKKVQQSLIIGDGITQRQECFCGWR